MGMVAAIRAEEGVWGGDRLRSRAVFGVFDAMIRIPGEHVKVVCVDAAVPAVSRALRGASEIDGSDWEVEGCQRDTGFMNEARMPEDVAAEYRRQPGRPHVDDEHQLEIDLRPASIIVAEANRR